MDGMSGMMKLSMGLVWLPDCKAETFGTYLFFGGGK